MASSWKPKWSRNVRGQWAKALLLRVEPVMLAREERKVAERGLETLEVPVVTSADTGDHCQQRLDRILREELKKFGISPHAEGISDAKHAVVAAALERQRAYRLSTAPLNERKIMEYERSTVLWQIERAVHSRDMSILESIFDGGTESDSGNETYIEGPGSEDEEMLQSPSADRSERMVRGHDLDFEADFSGKRSTSCQGSDHSDVYGRLREHSQLSDVHSVTRNSLTRHSLDGLETHSFQVMGQMTAQRVPSISDDHQQQHNIVLSAVSSPTAKVPEHPFEHPEENIGLGDWESEGEEHSSFAYNSPRRSAKGEQQDGASTSSKNREVYKDLLKG